MKRLIFDIETIGADFTKLDKASQQYILRWAKNAQERREAKEQLALSPFTGEIIAIGLLDFDTSQGGVYFQAPKAKALKEWVENDVRFVPSTEKEILERFWAVVKNYQQVVTFNGRSFDAPYILIRSMAHGLKATKNLVPNRYAPDLHCDLKDQLQFYGALSRGFNFHLACRALGIASPKANGITGYDVPKLFKKKKYELIARYCLDDVRATKRLFQKWRQLWSN